MKMETSISFHNMKNCSNQSYKSIKRDRHQTSVIGRIEISTRKKTSIYHQKSKILER